ncbi:MAG: hypothetical protein KBS55_03760 [Bacteroidales bacterium]|nr:hypothetical protein [Candidatus Cryptobacteroides aphodequi]
MKRFFALLAALSLIPAFSLGAQDGITLSTHPKLPSDIYAYRVPEPGYEGRGMFYRPVYFVFPDSRCTIEQADVLLEELGIAQGEPGENLGAVYFINPAGAKYDDKADFERYEAAFNSMFVSVNLKVIGIGNGATFVNSAIAPRAAEVAGILSIGGKAPKKFIPGNTVPAYIAGSNASAVAKDYRKRNAASNDEFLQVVTAASGLKSLGDIFADSWDKVLCKNVRYTNYGHTGYMGARLGQYPEYELEPYMIPERLGMKVNMVERNLGFSGKDYMWYEYLPGTFEGAAEKSVPMVVLLHGNYNDPRTQAETSGFLNLAAEEGFFVAEMEWQGGRPGKYAWMGMDGVEVAIYDILSRYPQIDPSRIYAEGMSAGGFSCTAVGVHKSYLFAAVGCHSGGVVTGHLGEKIILGSGYSEKSLNADAAQKRGKVTMPYFYISGTADDAVPFVSHMDIRNPYSSSPVVAPEESFGFKAWQLYQRLNGAPVSTKVDFSVDPVFGIELSDRITTQAKGFTVDQGDIVVGDVPVCRLVAVDNYGHWNFVPGARMMWEYFKMFSRDPETKEIIYSGK